MIQLLLSLLNEDQTHKLVEAMLDFPELAGNSRHRVEYLRGRSFRPSHDPSSGSRHLAAAPPPPMSEPTHPNESLGLSQLHTQPDPAASCVNHSHYALDPTNQHQHHPAPVDPHLLTVDPRLARWSQGEAGVNSRIRNAATTPIDPVETKKYRPDNAELSDNLDALLLESSGLAGFAGTQVTKVAEGAFERAASAPVVPREFGGSSTGEWHSNSHCTRKEC